MGGRAHFRPPHPLAARRLLRERGALDSTIHHELLHVFVEAQAATGLPVWFREGLVGYLEHPVRHRRSPSRRRPTCDRPKTPPALAAPMPPPPKEWRPWSSATASPAVLAWLKTGLPAGTN